MSEPLASPGPPEGMAAPPPPKKSTQLRTLLIAAAVGAVVGALIPRSGKAAPHSVWLPFSPMAISFYLWIAMSLYWSWAARGKSAVRLAESGASRQLHVVMINVALLISYWPFDGWPWTPARFYQSPRVLPATPYLAPIGLALAVLGLLLTLWARNHLGRNWSGEVTLKVDHELVRSGPYRWVRHPIYTGAITIYIGTALISGRLQGPLSLALIAFAYWRKIRQEERVLSAEFGPAWEEYRRGTWAVYPGM